MSLNILSVLPDVNSSGVILQGAVIVTFDQEIDVTTFSENSFLLSAPAPYIAPGGLVGSVIHPFDDGNGRIHRFLVHHVLTKLEFTPPGILFPVSAAMLRDRLSYDQVLERFSASIMPFIRYDLDPARGMTVHNDTASLYRYFDATPQAEYLYRCIEETIRHDLRDELGFIAVFDAALRGVLNIVDMPNRRASLLTKLILQNKGKLSRGKRPAFAEITDEEMDRIESTVWEAWEDVHQAETSKREPLANKEGDLKP